MTPAPFPVIEIIALAHAGWSFGRIAEVLKIPIADVIGVLRNGV